MTKEPFDDADATGSDSDTEICYKKVSYSPLHSMQIYIFYIQTKEGEQESLEIPCIYCAELFKGKKGLERHEKYCILKKQFDK